MQTRGQNGGQPIRILEVTWGYAYWVLIYMETVRDRESERKGERKKECVRRERGGKGKG